MTTREFLKSTLRQLFLLLDDYRDQLRVEDQRFDVLAALIYASIPTSKGKPKPRYKSGDFFPRLHITDEERLASAPDDDVLAQKLFAAAAALGAKIPEQKPHGKC